MTYTMHPEVIGRPYRMRELAELVTALRASPNVWFARHGDVAKLVSAQGQA